MVSVNFCTTVSVSQYSHLYSTFNDIGSYTLSLRQSYAIIRSYANVTTDISSVYNYYNRKQQVQRVQKHKIDTKL